MAINQTLLQKIEKDLLERKKKLEKELLRFAEPDPKNKDNFNTKFPQYGNAEDENANEVAIFADSLSLERTLEKSLRDINSALKRIKQSSYGTCKYCRQMIDEKRLIARPFSSSCVSCKKKFTQEE